MEIYDYIVVGAGSAGCAVARRLSDDPAIRVLLLEAGPAADDFWVRTPAGMARLFKNDRVNWNYYTEPLSSLGDRRIYYPRGKVLGGSSSINGMAYIRGHRLDFDHWKSLGNPGVDRGGRGAPQARSAANNWSDGPAAYGRSGDVSVTTR
jgi:choline dehydrogenase